MRNTVTLTASAVMLAASLAAANAADLYNPSGSTKDPVSSIFSAAPGAWTGFYLGGNIGYAFEGSRGDVSLYHYDATGKIVTGDTKILQFPEVGGVVGGVEAGYQRQLGSFVFGIAADFNGSAFIGDKGKITAGTEELAWGTNGKATDKSADKWGVSQDVLWYGTARIKIGAPVGSLLPYVTGGLAYGDVRNKVYHQYTVSTSTGALQPEIDAATAAGISESWSNNGVRVGYVVGGGVEYRPAGSWSFSVDYRYVDLGSQDISHSFYDDKGVLQGSLGTTKINSDFHAVTIGLKYYLN